MTQATSARGAARSFAIVVSFATVVLVAAACTLAGRADGEACIKSGDCLSGLCVQMVCAAQPPLLDAEAKGGDAATGDDGAAGDATTDTGSAGSDTGSPVESGTPEAAADTGAGASEAGSDAGTSDASAD